jgi:hypothetical protein
MKARDFRRKVMKGVMTPTNTLKACYEKGDLKLTHPNHNTIKFIVQKDLGIVRDGILSLTIKGENHVKILFPNSVKYIPEIVEEIEEEIIPEKILFKDLNIGDKFDFISPRKYTWKIEGEPFDSQVGSINVEVYHVNEKEM